MRYIRVWVMLINEKLFVTVKCRTTITVLFLDFNLCLSVLLNSLSHSFTFISFLTNIYVCLYFCSWVVLFTSADKCYIRSFLPFRCYLVINNIKNMGEEIFIFIMVKKHVNLCSFICLSIASSPQKPLGHSKI
jgi:hypothetical protein